ncbi:unnamed protein product, partial [Brachionus calyciflorus]
FEQSLIETCLNRVYSKNKIALTTIVANEKFVLSSKKLIKSVIANTRGIEYDKIIIEVDEFPLKNEWKDDLLKAGWDLVCTVKRIQIYNETRLASRYRTVFTKLILFNMTQYDGIVFIDSDAFAIGDITSLFYFHNILDNNNYYLAVGPNYAFKGNYAKTEFNSGVFTLRPNKTEFDRLQKLCLSDLSHIGLGQADQNFLNYYYKDKWINIGFKFNFLTYPLLNYNFTYEFIIKNTRIIHFAGAKPWSCYPQLKFICKLWNDIKV